MIMIKYTTAMRNIVQSQIVAEIATATRSGIPHLSAVWYVFDEPDILFGIDKRSKKHRNLTANPQIALMIGHDLHKTQTVTLFGHATIITSNDPLFNDTFQQLVDKHPPQATFRSPHSRLVRVTPHTILHYTSGGATIKRTT